jgi:hypothetical protein
MAMKCILCYLQGMPDYGLLLWCSSSSDLIVYTDTDWAGCLDTRRSTSGYMMFLEDNLVSWSAKWQTVITRSSVEASIAPLPTAWLRPLGYVSCSMISRPHRLGAPLPTMTISVLHTYPPTLFSINAPSMWRLIFILSERRLSSVKSVSSMS